MSESTGITEQQLRKLRDEVARDFPGDEMMQQIKLGRLLRYESLQGRTLAEKLHEVVEASTPVVAVGTRRG